MELAIDDRPTEYQERQVQHNEQYAAVLQRSKTAVLYETDDLDDPYMPTRHRERLHPCQVGKHV